jgi:hypothetical protein
MRLIKGQRITRMNISYDYRKRMLACLQPVNDEVAFGSKKTKGWRVPVTIASSPKTPHSATNAVAPACAGVRG